MPVKFNLVEAAGVAVDSAAANPAISIVAGSCKAQPIEPVALSAEDAGESGWHYDPETRTWGFGWSTKKLRAGCYWIRLTTGEPEFPAPEEMFPIALR